MLEYVMESLENDWFIKPKTTGDRPQRLIGKNISIGNSEQSLALMAQRKQLQRVSAG